jgi:hypothetical protein
LPIFAANCATSQCHGGGVPKGGLSLTAAAAYGELVTAASETCTNETRVVPGDVGKSYLVNKLTGIGMCAGSRMPKSGPLPDAEIDLFRRWICDGAPNN